MEKEQLQWGMDQTRLHIGEVQSRMLRVVENLSDRAASHDASKLCDPEAEAFAITAVNLRGITYGSPEYREELKKLGPAINHHYANNSHHPEHHANGINDMSLLDLIEMLVDWKAASMRHADGCIKRSIEINAERFGMSPQLKGIFYKTAAELGYITEVAS